VEGRDIVTGEISVPTSLNINNLRKAAVLHFASRSLLWLVPNSACRSLSTIMLMSSSHRLLIIHSPHKIRSITLNLLGSVFSGTQKMYIVMWIPQGM
jgi:hypothetical protein